MAPFMTSNGARLAPWLESAWLQRYLDRQLDADETAWFEEYVVGKPHLLERIDADSDVRDAVAHGAAELRSVQAEAAEAVPHDVPLHATPVRAASGATAAPHRRRYGAAISALAATIVAGVGIGWFGRQALAPSAPSVIASPMRVVFDPERGADSPPRIDHRQSVSAYVLIEAPVPPGASDIDFVIDADANRVTPSSDGFVSVLVDRKGLNAGTRVVLRYRWRDAVREQVLDLPAAATARP